MSLYKGDGDFMATDTRVPAPKPQVTDEQAERLQRALFDSVGVLVGRKNARAALEAALSGE